MNIAHLNGVFKWLYYFCYPPSWDMEIVLRDFKASKPLKQVCEEKGIDWDEYSARIRSSKGEG